MPPPYAGSGEAVNRVNDDSTVSKDQVPINALIRTTSADIVRRKGQGKSKGRLPSGI